jgi:hypothetical protein
MAAAGDALRAAGVGCIYLVHGTHAGLDALGVWAELGRWYPPARDSLGRLTKQAVDAIIEDRGNYTPGYAQAFADAINRPGQPQIEVRLFNWSSENNHLGRADGAVQLIDELARLELPSGQRVLLWGHSHAGNVFALMTNLLAPDAPRRARFFRAARVYFRQPLTGRIDIPLWRDVQVRLRDGLDFLERHPLDLVTFGTPIRYGWDLRGCAKLLHFIYHRPSPNLPPYRAAFPPLLDDVLTAAGGDYVQQVGIAGTNTAPGLLTWRTWLADRRLNRLLQPGLRSRDLWARLCVGARVPEAGTTLLVDYGRVTGNLVQHLGGHAIYTQQDWLLFHVEEVVARLYGTACET